ncbi:MAG TPA: DUF4019 domain-containing protein [Rhizomicrobium sp.]
MELEKQARRTAIDFMANMDSGKYADAYAVLTDMNQKDQPFSDFSERVRRFNARAGSVIERRIVTVTWTKDPSNAPLPGVYVALDVISRFTNIDRDCGYLVLFQPPSAGPFKVMREENNFLDNLTAAKIAKQNSPAEVSRAWARLSANCPGYGREANPPPQSPSAVPLTPLTEVKGPSIGYPSVDAALTALHSKAGVVFTTVNGWTVANDAAAQAIWSFPPPNNQAFPAAVKRQLVVRHGATYIEMAVHCDASKSACDDLVRSFEKLNAEMEERLRNHR